MTVAWSSSGSSKGPNLYFPRAAIKLTLDLTGAGRRARARPALRFAPPDRAAQRPARGARQRASGSGSPPRAVARLVRQVARGGGHHPARRAGAADQRPAPDRGRLPVAPPRRGPRRSAARSPRCSTRCPAADVEDAGQRGRRARSPPPSRAPAPTTITPADPGRGGHRHQRQDHDVADDRPHRAAPHGLHVGWSNTDGIYVDGELVEAGDYSGPERRRPGAGPPAGRARGHRDRPRRHPAQGHRR